MHAIDDQGLIASPPVEWRYTAYGCHGIEVDPSNRYVFVPHVARSGGPNAVAQFRFDEKTGRVTPNVPAFLELKNNEGPRHLLVHPTLNVAYSSDEQGASATAYRLDPSTGTLVKLQSISTVPSDYRVKSEATCSEVLIHPNGKLLFVVTREHNSIASFIIDQTTGRLSAADRVPTEPGVRPLCLDPSGRFMAAAGSGGTAGRLVTYRDQRGHRHDDTARCLRRRQRTDVDSDDEGRAMNPSGRAAQADLSVRSLRRVKGRRGRSLGSRAATYYSVSDERRDGEFTDGDCTAEAWADRWG